MLELNQLRHVLSELFFISASDKNRDLSVAVRTNHLLALVRFSIKESNPFTIWQVDLSGVCVFFQKRRNKQCIAKHILVLAGKCSFIFGPEEGQRPHHRHIASHTRLRSLPKIRAQPLTQLVPEAHLIDKFRRVVGSSQIPRAAFVVALTARHQLFELPAIRFGMPLHDRAETGHLCCAAIEVQRRKRASKPGNVKAPEQDTGSRG